MSLWSKLWRPAPHCECTAEPSLQLVIYEHTSMVQCLKQLMRLHKLDVVISSAREPEGCDCKLIIDDENVVRKTKAILKYVCRLLHIYPSKNIAHAAIVDQWLECCDEFERPFLDGAARDGEDLRQILGDHVSKYLDIFDTELEHGAWLGDFEDLTIADFCLFFVLRTLLLHHDLPIEQYENVHAHYQRVAALFDALQLSELAESAATKEDLTQS